MCWKFGGCFRYTFGTFMEDVADALWIYLGGFGAMLREMCEVLGTIPT